VDAMEAEIEQIEETVFKGQTDRLEVERIYELRRELLNLRRAISPLREVCNRVMRPGMPLIDPGMHPYFRDVDEHVIRIDESIDMSRELLTSVFESSIMLASSRQNEVTKKLAAWAAILAVPTALAGIYGMNFEFMPELKLPYGYYAVLGVIVGLCGYLY